MRTLLLALLLAAFAAAPAVAQDPDPVDDGPDVEQPEADEEVEEPEPTPDPCDGADAQYLPEECGYDPCEGADFDYGADGDYAYCPQASGNGPPRGRKRRDAPAVAAPAALRTLPLTGSEVLLVGMLGVAFLLGGSGLRLIVR